MGWRRKKRTIYSFLPHRGEPPASSQKSGLLLRGGAASTRDEGMETIPSLFAGNRLSLDHDVINFNALTDQRINELKKVSFKQACDFEVIIVSFDD